MEKLKDVLTEENRVLVLDDNSTYTEGVNDCHIVWFSSAEGLEDFVECDNLSRLKDGSSKWCVSVNHLVDCWMEKYGEHRIDTEYE